MRPQTLRPWLHISALRRISTPIRRTYAVQAPGAPTLQVFNDTVKYLQKERAALNVDESRASSYLKDEVARRLVDRLLDIDRSFPQVLDLGANSCHIARALSEPPLPTEEDASAPTKPKVPLSQRIHHLTCAETSLATLHRDDDLPEPAVALTKTLLPSLEHLPYAPNTFDAVLSSLSLHWINDLPSTLASINNILKPDSPFIAAMFGGDTLYELRSSLQLADLERRGGVTPHISPLADVRDIGGLLNRAGFKLLTVDVDDIVVEYPDTFALMADVQAMGEGNAVLRNGTLSREVLLANEAIYRELHVGEDGDKGRIPATFRVIYMIGWKEGEGQQKPLARGSGQVNIKDVLGGGEFS
ncbi:NADH dehydrogenase [ubiquinone] 1 alpha subcomplex assembly factor 5 [Cyphellophora attinorum]|uniref:NADH dehydrogenase [ubiquinone] 1 alpha subcomplex assembly factor 5 n=1 Tax=Cyphellophora attinorum TaxID=1664694 RepID=A0A0N0NL56_9EURO|nr:NADH dehydrogenase [ubiquinone] 1 alpha subcomplex assembly factor 5 [Phialophora attinorum]KPI38911.1 NADH dehydrogenase [ubiquinone] 1 alpha subcomplex assembly factor 5 [Phialophora attinorum]